MLKLKSDKEQDLKLYLWLAINPQNAIPLIPYQGIMDLNYSLDESMKSMPNILHWTNIGNVLFTDLVKKTDIATRPHVEMIILDQPVEREKNVIQFIHNLELLSDEFLGDTDKKTIKRIIKKIKN